MLTENDRIRYERNLLIPGVGEAGQERLANAKVLVVGLGGLGGPVCCYLAAAGVGTLGLLDADTVELSNLQRQILHAAPRLGCLKTESAVALLSALNPSVNTPLYSMALTEANACDLIAGFDVVVEASDTFETKFVVNDACLTLGRPFATAGVVALSGQALFVVPGRTPCLRCLLPEAPEGVPTSLEAGVLGAAAGLLGCLEALEALRWIIGLWEPPPGNTGRLHRLDGEAMRLNTLHVPRRTDCPCARLGSPTS